MSFLSNTGLPPWLIPLAIVHVAMVLVLLIPALRAFGRAGAGAWQALWLVLPGLGLVIVAVLMMMRVMPVAQKPRLMALLVIIPLVNVLFLWLFAFGKWSESGDRPRRPVRDRTKPEEGQAREVPTLSGGGEVVERADGPAMVEPTLHAGAAVGAPAVSAEAAASQSDDAASASGPSEADQPAAAEPQGDHTIVAGAAAVQAAAGPKARTKVAARTDDAVDDENADDAGDRSDFDLVATDASEEDESDQDDAYDEDGEPIGARLPEAEQAAADKFDSDPALPEIDVDGDEERDLRAPGITEEDVALAKGVVDDLNQGGADPTESPMVAELPLTDVAPDRVWLVRGVNARAANIEASIREEDVSRSVTGILVGRSNRADFIIDDESVSRNHARFVYQDGALQVEDLDSMNGTWLDGEKLNPNEPEPLRRASDVEFGKIRLEVKEIDPDKD